MILLYPTCFYTFPCISRTRFIRHSLVIIVIRVVAGRPLFYTRQRQVLFPFRHRVQTCFGVHTTFYRMGTRGLFPAVKQPGREAVYSRPYSAEVKNVWSCTSLSPTSSRRGA